MFLNVPPPPDPAVSDAAGPRRQHRLLGMVMSLNVLVCVLIGVSWSVSRGRGSSPGEPRPSPGFWRRPDTVVSFWNREQRRLDLLSNPLLSSGLSGPEDQPDWLRDPGPADPCDPDPRVPVLVPDYGSLPRPFRDFLLHMRCRTFPLRINQPGLCRRTPFLLLVVKSLIQHFERRQAIRETWGRTGTYGNQTVATVFLLGNLSPSDHFPDLLGLLGHEAELHKDLLQWDYRDTFLNLTLKEVLFLEWFGQNCPGARFVLKGDDDVFVNTLKILEFLEKVPESQDKDFFMGDVISDARPHRDHALKYFVPESVFVGRYPPYAGGGGYLLSGELALRLHAASRRVALYPIDDVYTGMCLEKLGVVPEKHSGFKTFGVEEKFRRNPCTYRSLMLVHSLTPQEMLRVWPWVTDPGLGCQ